MRKKIQVRTNKNDIERCRTLLTEAAPAVFRPVFWVTPQSGPEQSSSSASFSTQMLEPVPSVW